MLILEISLAGIGNRVYSKDVAIINQTDVAWADPDLLIPCNGRPSAQTSEIMHICLYKAAASVSGGGGGGDGYFGGVSGVLVATASVVLPRETLSQGLPLEITGASSARTHY